MSERPKRKGMSIQTKLHSALYALGLEPGNVDWHHQPALGLRPLNDDGTDTDPAQNDPRYIIPMAREAHKERTPSDVKAIAKTKRLEKKHKEFWDKLRPMSSIYVEGEEAAHRGEPETNNPYLPDTDERAAWAGGWHKAVNPPLRSGWKRRIPSKPFPRRAKIHA